MRHEYNVKFDVQQFFLFLTFSKKSGFGPVFAHFLIFLGIFLEFLEKWKFWKVWKKTNFWGPIRGSKMILKMYRKQKFLILICKCIRVERFFLGKNCESARWCQIWTPCKYVETLARVIKELAKRYL